MKDVSSSPFVLSWADFCLVWHKYRKWILAITLGSLSMGIFLSFITPMRYTAKALFREGKTQGGMISSVSSAILSSMINVHDESSIVAMQTDRILRSVVQELGLQVQVQKAGRLSTYLQRALQNARVLCGAELIERSDFEFENVEYRGRKPLYFSFVFTDEDHIDLFDRQGSLVGAATLGDRIMLQEASFSFTKRASHTVIGKSYQAKILPWVDSVADILKNLEIRAEKLDKSLLKLFYSHPDRTSASKILDCIMAVYLHYLQEENDRVAQKQLEFLDKRQTQFVHKFEEELNEYVTCLQQNISKYGFFEVEQQIEFLALPQQELKSKLIELDNWLSRFKKIQESYYYAIQNELPEGSQELTKAALPSIMQIGHKNRSEQFAGIDLDTALGLHTNYQKEVDAWQEKIDTLSFLLASIQSPDFDLNALGVLIHDSVTESLIQRARELTLQLKDASNHSPKDLMRIDESLSLQKNYIVQHLRQSLELYRQNAWIDRQKLARLRDIMMTLIEGEKTVIYKKLQEIQAHLAEVPARLKMEKQIELKSQLIQKIVEGLTQVIEGKTLDHQLKQLSSKVVDSAYAFSLPNRSSFFLLIMIFFGSGALSSYLFFFCRLLWRGFPLTESTACALQFRTGGSFGPYCDAPLAQLTSRDMDALYSLADFIQREKKQENRGIVVALAGNKYPPFAHNIAHLFTMRKKKTLLIDASFRFAQSHEKKGNLWDYLTESSENWHVHRTDGWDKLPSGGTGRFCSELLHNERFAQLLRAARSEYDIILVIIADVFSSYARSSSMDLLIVAVQEETLEQLDRNGIVERLRHSSAMVVFYA